MPADVVWQTMRDAAGTHLNKEMVEIFLRVLPPYPLGTMVRARIDGALPYDLLCTPVEALVTR